MHAARIVGFGLLLAVAACGARRDEVARRPPPPPVRAPSLDVDSLGDGWVGGFEGASEGSFLRIDFASGTARLHPRAELAPLGIVHPKLTAHADGAAEVSFLIDDGKQRRTFALKRTASDVLDGSVSEPRGRSGYAQLFRLGAFDRAAVDGVFAGTYALDGDAKHLLFIDDGSLFDARDGTERRLFLFHASSALVGAGAATAYPTRGVATFDDAGALHLSGRTSIVAPRFEVRKEDVSFESGGVTLRGVLLSPPGPGPHPAVVNVHGSGHVTRSDHWGNAMARVFLGLGYAVLLYDKRGVGASGGEYVGRGGRDTNNVSAENLDRLANDAATAAALLASRKDIDRARVGLIGLSQAGWIVPMAAKKSKAVRFIALMSGPAVNTTVELAYSALVGDGESCLPIEEADRVAREHAPRTGVDPAPVIASLDVPGLWLYGALDASIPVPASMRALEPLQKTHAFEVKLIPNAGHELYIVKRDTEDERLLSPGLSPMVIETLQRWLPAHVK